jgi:hypothetical protein
VELADRALSETKEVFLAYFFLKKFFSQDPGDILLGEEEVVDDIWRNFTREPVRNDSYLYKFRNFLPLQTNQNVGDQDSHQLSASGKNDESNLFEFESVDSGEQALPTLDKSLEFKRKLADIQTLKQEEFWTKPLEGNNIFLAVSLQRKLRNA